MSHAARSTLRHDLAVWARSEGLCWMFIFKMLAAALTTLWLAMRLDMPQPSTAVMAVFIVMQPQSGQVIAKGLHRLLGTLIGLLAMLPLIALFNQEPVLFLGGMAIWVALCTAGAARYRDLRSYSCVLAGYTATLISLTAIQHPETAFIQALWRVLEIGLGVLCCSLFSAAILPQTTGSAMRKAVAGRFGDFASVVVTHLPGGKRAAFEDAQARLAAHTVRLETLRSMSGFDDPQLNLRMGRLTRLNHDFMAMTSRFHALQQLLERLRGQGANLALHAFAPCLDSLAALLAPWRQRHLDIPGAAELAAQLEDYRTQLMPLIRQSRSALDNLAPDSPLRLDFDTAAELLYRLADDLLDYARTHAALAPARHERERWSERFAPRANRFAVAAAALRILLLTGLGSAIWLQTAWPSGHMFLITAVIIGALASASANPARLAMQMAGGTLLAALLGFVESFLVFPQISGFPMLRWMTLVLEIGHAVIELRQEKARLPDESSYAEDTAWRRAFAALSAALVRLFANPTAAHLSEALAQVERAIDAARSTPEARAPHFDSSPLRRLESYLHFIRTTLLDPHSPLAERLPPPGAAHAA